MGSRDNIPLDELFAAAGLTEKEGRKVLENAIDHGYFGTDAYIDNRTGFLVVRGPAPIPAQPAPSPNPMPAGRPSTRNCCASCIRPDRPSPTPT